MSAQATGFGAKVVKGLKSFGHWLLHPPMNILELILMLAIIASGALLVMTILRFPFTAGWPQSQVDYWVEVCSQLLNACFTFNALRFFIPRGIQLYWVIKLNEARKKKDWSQYGHREEQLLLPYAGVVCALSPEEMQERRTAVAEVAAVEANAEDGGVGASTLDTKAAENGKDVPMITTDLSSTIPPNTLDNSETQTGTLPPKSPTSPIHPRITRKDSSAFESLGRKKASFEPPLEEQEEYAEKVEAAIEMGIPLPATEEGPPPYPIPWTSMLWILIFLNLNCWFQWPMAFFMWYWAVDYTARPAWGVYTFLVLSFGCMIVGFVWLGYYMYKNRKEWKKAHPPAPTA